MGATYAEAGVDLAQENATITTITDALLATFSNRQGKLGEVIPQQRGHFANYVRMGDKYAVLCTDGVGTKVLVAQMMRRYDTVGVDMIAMNVNDMICVGAEPIAMVDYLACETHDPQMMREISQGLVEGARQAGIAIIGGETATLKGVITGIEGRGFDLAGTCLGIVDQDKVITGQLIEEGDAIVGLASSGIHSNGLSLARKVLLKADSSVHDSFSPGRTVGEELLVPTSIYVRPVLDLLAANRSAVHAMYHITGSGFLKFRRLRKDMGFHIEHLLPIPRIFAEIQRRGNIPDEEMLRTFNMGMGFAIVTSDPDSAIAVAKRHAVRAQVVGRIDRSKIITIEEKGVSYPLEANE